MSREACCCDTGGAVSTKPSDFDHPELPPDVSVDELIAAVGAQPVTSIDDLDRLAADIWDSDDELEAFVADVRASRNADLA